MQFIKGNLNNIIFCAYELVMGILILINPEAFTLGIIIIAGALLMVTGVINLYKYIIKNAEEAMREQYLTKGLLALMTGLFCALQTDWFLSTFPVLTTLYGVAVLVLGVSKVQLMFDMIRLKHKKWAYAGLNALITIVCAVIILMAPFGSTQVLWIFIGVSLIIEAIFDVVTLVLSYKAKEEGYEIIEG